MDISVVLCTYNSAERLRVTLQSFCRLNQPEGLDWELVAVNNNSTDNTEPVIKSFDDRLPIRYVYEPEQGLSRARNAGLDVAEGELIVFTDDDVKPNPDWLVAYWEAYQEHPEGYYFGGPIQSEFEGEPPDEDLLEIAMHSITGLDHGPESRQLASDEILIGANWACPSSYLRQVGKFDENLGLGASAEEVRVGEEIELMSRLDNLDVKTWYVPKAVINHFVPDSKCNIYHISSRIAADITDNYPPGGKNLTSFLGIPLGLYKSYIFSIFRYAFSMVSGEYSGKYYMEVVKWKKRISKFY